MDFFFHTRASFLCQMTFIKMPNATLNNYFITNIVRSQLSKILADGNFSLLKDSPLPSSILVTRDCLITQWALHLFMGANKMNSLSEPFATSFLLHLNSQDLKKIIVSHQLWMDLLWVLGGSDDSFHCLNLDVVWIWITPSSHHDYDFFWQWLEVCYPPYQQSASWCSEFGLCVFVWIRTSFFLSHWVIVAK